MIDILPIELLIEILMMLPISEILLFAVVSKRCQQIVRAVRLRTLVICETKSELFNERWSCTGQPINAQTFHQLHCFHTILQIPPDDQLFASLKQLYVRSNSFRRVLLHPFFFEYINRLKNIERCELINFEYQSVRSETKLDLPKLQVLNLENFYYETIVLNTPKLRALRLDHDGGVMQFEQPASVRFLEFANSLELNILKSLKELEVLHVLEIVDLDDRFLCEFCPKLKEILFFEGRTALRKLLHQKNELDRQDLLIFYAGVRVECIDALPKQREDTCIRFLDDDKLEFYRENFERLSHRIPFVTVADYYELESRFDHIPMRLIRQNLKDLQCFWITANRLDMRRLLAFLSDCRPIFQEFCLFSASLDQSFFDHTLPTLYPSLKRISIGRYRALEFDFLLKFTETVQLIVLEHELPCTLIGEIILKSKFLKDFEFKFNGSEVTVDLAQRTVKMGLLGNKRFINHTHLVSYFYHLHFVKIDSHISQEQSRRLDNRQNRGQNRRQNEQGSFFPSLREEPKRVFSGLFG